MKRLTSILCLEKQAMAYRIGVGKKKKKKEKGNGVESRAYISMELQDKT